MKAEFAFAGMNVLFDVVDLNQQLYRKLIIFNYSTIIFDIIEVKQHNEYQNPDIRLSRGVSDPVAIKDAKQSRQLEEIKYGLNDVFNTYYKAKLTGTIGKADVAKITNPSETNTTYYEPTTTIFDYIKDKLLVNITDRSEGDSLYTLLYTNRDTLPTILNRPDSIATLIEYSNTDAFIQFIRSKTTTATATATATGGSRRRKTLRLQARQKPGRRALTHKQVHHKEDENA